MDLGYRGACLGGEGKGEEHRPCIALLLNEFGVKRSKDGRRDVELSRPAAWTMTSRIDMRIPVTMVMSAINATLRLNMSFMAECLSVGLIPLRPRISMKLGR